MNERSSRRRSAVEHAVLDAALRAFADRGFHGATMRQIAGLADVTLANVYNYFDSKADLLTAVLRRAGDDQLAATTAAVHAAAGPVSERLRAAVGAYVRFDLERQAESRVAHTEYRYLDTAQRLRLDETRDRQRMLFTDLVKEGVSSGAFRTPYPEHACGAILTMCVGASASCAAAGPLSAEDVEQRYTRYALALLEAT